MKDFLYTRCFLQYLPLSPLLVTVTYFFSCVTTVIQDTAAVSPAHFPYSILSACPVPGTFSWAPSLHAPIELRRVNLHFALKAGEFLQHVV